MDEWLLVENPAWAGKEPPEHPFTESDCHDRSYFVTVECRCGESMHMHESQWIQAAGQGIRSRCHGCKREMTFPPGYFDQALDEMRKRGWVA